MMSSFDSYHLVWHVGFVQKIPERRYTPPPVCHSNKEYKHWICGTISGQIDRKGMVIAPSRLGSMHLGVP